MAHKPPVITDLDPAVWKLFDEYVHGTIDRRAFLERVGRYALGGLTAAGILGMLQPKFAAAQKVPVDDPRLRSTRVDIPSPKGNGTIRALLVRPLKPAGKRPGVVVIHENRGLNPHIEDVARRVALEGYLALAPDALTTLGGYPGNEDDARTLFGKLDQGKAREDFAAATELVLRHAECTGKVGTVGFCWGGGMATWLASRVSAVKAAVSFYGIAPSAEDVAKIKAYVVAHYAATDERINASAPGFEAALKQAGVKHAIHHYPGTQHGFHNDTTPRFDEASAKLAWQRTLEVFKKNLA
jgi:carboxymethylenebutenolidase